MIRIRLDRNTRVPTLNLTQGTQGTMIVQLEVPRWDCRRDLMELDFVIQVIDPDRHVKMIRPYCAPLLTEDIIAIDWLIDASVTEVAGVGEYRVYGSGWYGTEYQHIYVSEPGTLMIREREEWEPKTVHVEEFAEYIAQYKADVDKAAEVSLSCSEAATSALRAAELANSAADRLTMGTAIPGKAATVTIGSVTAGAFPSITNSGTSTDAVFDFVIPKGEQGDDGETPDLYIRSVREVGNGETPQVKLTRNGNRYGLDFILPQGATGPAGETGPEGPRGIDGLPGTDASIKNLDMTEAFGQSPIHSRQDLTMLGIQYGQWKSSSGTPLSHHLTLNFTFAKEYAEAPMVFAQIGENTTGNIDYSWHCAVSKVTTTGCTVYVDSSHSGSYNGFVNVAAIGFYTKVEPEQEPDTDNTGEADNTAPESQEVNVDGEQ